MSKKHPDNEPAPDSTWSSASDTSEEAANIRLREQSEASAARLTAGQQTATTPDSESGASVETKSIGELDAQTPQERLSTLRGWAKEVRLGGPRQADWEKFDALVGQDEPEPAEPKPLS